ncbi:hypothetical protein [Methanobrevibacter curvatus]|uniref:Uncharacterized protein n=1 Tax=Methanobrevibacter curvatus TaxID=49547 RepID=A0A166C1U3_9EURY|nr:hypothetical protein [Methanobrevibacter curvatus]KZX14042.1 hypothetical protein MBCUR_06600 [Methanobrevibacter curvatus]
MKLRNLIYICIATILIIACVSLIYTNLDNEQNTVENSSKINNTNSINNSNINETENNSNHSTNEITPVKNIKGSNNFEKKNQPKNLPKNSRLSYSKAYSIANSYKGGVDGDDYNMTYMKYKGYEYDKGRLYWNFGVYFKKNNEWLGTFRVSDATGEIDLG